MDQSSEAATKRPRRRGNGEGTIAQRDNGTWYARLRLGDGRRVTLYGKTRGEVQAKLRAAQRAREDGLNLSAKRQTVATYLDDWLEHTAKPTLRPSTYASYSSLVRIHLKPGIGRHQLSALTPQHVQALMNSRRAAGLSPATITRMRAVLRRALGQALKWGLVTRNVAALTDPPRVVTTPVQPLTLEQARHLMDAARDDMHGPLLTVAIATGLRQGELFGLRWTDVDLERGVLRVSHAMQRVGKVPTFIEPKTARSRRTINLPAFAVDALRVQRERQNERRLFHGPAWQDWGLVFSSSIGTPLNPSNVIHRFHAILELAGLPRQRFHDLRHCAASLLLSAGEHPRVVMDVLGHSQIALTMNTYSHVMPAALEQAAERMDALFADAETA